MKTESINITLLLFFFLCNSIYSQNDLISIQGKIVNTAFDSIAFANIVSLKTSKGTFSDKDGEFKIKAFITDTLLFSAIGYKTKKMPVSGFIPEKNTIILDSLIYVLAEINIMDVRWRELKQEVMEMELKPEEQKILKLEGLPDPYMELVPIEPNMVMNPVSFLYEYFKKESVRKRRQARWNKIYQKSRKKVEQQNENDTLYLPIPVTNDY
jgi:hypothetical protein